MSTIVNRALPYLHGGSLEITLSVPLTPVYLLDPDTTLHSLDSADLGIQAVLVLISSIQLGSILLLTLLVHLGNISIQ